MECVSLLYSDTVKYLRLVVEEEVSAKERKKTHLETETETERQRQTSVHGQRLRVGDRVEYNSRSKGAWLPATIVRLRRDGTVCVRVYVCLLHLCVHLSV